MSKMAQDKEQIQNMKDRIADRYTASELCDLIDIPIQDLIEEYWDLIVRNAELFEGVFGIQDEEIDDYE